jgi:hypothetical protein
MNAARRARIEFFAQHGGNEEAVNAEITSVRLTIIPDDDPDFSWLEPDSGRYKGCSPEEITKYEAQDAERLADYGNGWTSVGVRAIAEIRFSEGTSVWAVGNSIETAGLWGIESDSGDYFDTIGDEELSELRDMLSALSFSSEAIDAAFADVKKDW